MSFLDAIALAGAGAFVGGAAGALPSLWIALREREKRRATEDACAELIRKATAALQHDLDQVGNMAAEALTLARGERHRAEECKRELASIRAELLEMRAQ